MGTTKISHDGLGVEIELPNPLKQRDLEMFEDILFESINDRTPEEITVESVNEGFVLRTADQCGWIDVDDVGEMRPNVVRWMSTVVFNHTRSFLLNDAQLDYLFNDYDQIKVAGIDKLEEGDLEKRTVWLTKESKAKADEMQDLMRDKYELPELLQRHIEAFDQAKAKRNHLMTSVASVNGNNVRIACDLGWIDMEKTEVSASDPMLIQCLSAHIDRHIKEALTIPPN